MPRSDYPPSEPTRFKIRLDTNQRRIHTPHSRGTVAASCLRDFKEKAKPTNSKARQWRAVMPVETGENLLSQTDSPRNQTPSQAENPVSAEGLFCADFSVL